MAEKFLLGYKGIFNSYTVKRNIKSCTSILLAVVSGGVGVSLFFTKDFEQVFSILNQLVEALIGILPGLLGFCIGGYAIVVAINSLEKMPALLEKQERTGLSYYVNLSADFAMTLIIMSVLLLAVFVTRFVLDLELTANSETLGVIVNLLLISVFLWAGTLAIVMIMGTVANLFNTSIILQTVSKIAAEKCDKGGVAEDGVPETIAYKVKSWLGTFTITRVVKK